MSKPNSESWFCLDLPIKDYMESLHIQRALVKDRAEGRIVSDVFLLLEHPPVFTLGRRGGRQNLMVDEAYLKQRGIPVVQAERGGDITYHGPGQLVGYLILNLREKEWDVKDLVYNIEEAIIFTVAHWGIRANRNPLNRGVWIGTEKIGSIGLAISRGVSFHGFSLNVNLNLEPFDWIKPCGLPGIRITSMEKVLGGKIFMENVRHTLKGQIQSKFGVDLKTVLLENMQYLIKESVFSQ